MNLEQLGAVPLFSGLDAEQLERLAERMQETDVPQDKILAFEGEFAYRFFIIEEGTASVSRGGEHVRDLGPGDFFGEIGLLESEKRTATVISETPMKVLVLMGWDLQTLEEEFPSIGEQIRAKLKERLDSDQHDR